MSALALGTSCIVAALCSWHERHFAVIAEVERRVLGGEVPCVAAHSLAEAYAVPTRLPPPHRISAEDVVALLEGSFAEPNQVSALDSEAYWAALRRSTRDGVVGGQIYDALIAAAARLGGASALLTLNPRHFSRFAGADLAVISPTPPQP